MKTPIDFAVVKLYREHYAGSAARVCRHCTAPIPGYFSDSPEYVRQEWDEEWAIRIKEGEEE